MEGVAQARKESSTVPEGADAIEFLAQPPAGRVGNAVPALGQEQGRRGHVGLGSLRLIGQIATKSGLLGGIAAQLAEVLAGPPFNGLGLIAPGGAGARIDAADVLEDVGFAPSLGLPPIRRLSGRA